MKPLICAPMGDPAGIGPEILAASLVDPVVAETARVLVVGNTEIMKRAAALMNVTPDFNEVDENLGGWREGAANILNMDNLDLADFAYGKIQAQCGKAAFEYIKKGVELTMAGKADVLATTPINKESLKAGGVPYIGHTEILGDLTGTADPLTMFQVHNLRVFFLTRHLSLMDACRAVKKERVLDYLNRCAEAMRLLGIENPSIVVAGLNPHCGEHGLFGNEEDVEIVPAIEEAKKGGLNAHGPNPADSVFHFALKGAWDAVLSLYHDQGHIATKMVDFERTISLTLGMPILRTSVDHGTAFDIAGKGKASAVSMVEAIRLAALYAPAFRNAHA
ncbi:4-hydroxythreonine-4-phosphate dehydrogenase PdxA [Desulfovibrio sp.]|uniref:4-hydroxythreonine-4-phosphate dehydrogenase PdxA n=1 Tax=Desulfovibrio sp. TaxID=885 RepID=UPI0025BEB6ED|nr:4-hydroxythreonine-4-phosphate dehydrogenase PdxA [Desulfovibrio sp.]